MLLAEALILLGLEADGTNARSVSTQASVAVGVTGALVTELAQERHLDLADGRVHLTGSRPDHPDARPGARQRGAPRGKEAQVEPGVGHPRRMEGGGGRHGERRPAGSGAPWVAGDPPPGAGRGRPCRPPGRGAGRRRHRWAARRAHSHAAGPGRQVPAARGGGAGAGRPGDGQGRIAVASEQVPAAGAVEAVVEAILAAVLVGAAAGGAGAATA